MHLLQEVLRSFIPIVDVAYAVAQLDGHVVSPQLTILAGDVSGYGITVVNFVDAHILNNVNSILLKQYVVCLRKLWDLVVTQIGVVGAVMEKLTSFIGAICGLGPYLTDECSMAWSQTIKRMCDSMPKGACFPHSISQKIALWSKSNNFSLSLRLRLGQARDLLHTHFQKPSDPDPSVADRLGRHKKGKVIKEMCVPLDQAVQRMVDRKMGTQNQTNTCLITAPCENLVSMKVEEEGDLKMDGSHNIHPAVAQPKGSARELTSTIFHVEHACRDLVPKEATKYAVNVSDNISDGRLPAKHACKDAATYTGGESLMLGSKQYTNDTAVLQPEKSGLFVQKKRKLNSQNHSEKIVGTRVSLKEVKSFESTPIVDSLTHPPGVKRIKQHDQVQISNGLKRDSSAVVESYFEDDEPCAAQPLTSQYATTIPKKIKMVELNILNPRAVIKHKTGEPTITDGESIS